MKWRWHPGYCMSGIALCILEAVIAIYVHDAIIRPFVGDILIVVVLYCMMCSVITWKHTVIVVTAFACLVEITQMIPLVDALGIQNTIIRIALGTTFDWMDILMYCCAGVLLWGWEHRRSVRNKK